MFNDNTLIRNLNPFVKMLSFVLFILSVLFVDNIYLFLILILLSLIALIVSKIKIKDYIKYIFMFSIIFILTIITSLLFRNNIFYNIIKIVCILTYYIVLVLSTPISNINLGVAFILKPLSKFNINIYEVSFIITSYLVFIPYLFKYIKIKFVSLRSRVISDSKIKLKDRIYILKNVLISAKNDTNSYLEEVNDYIHLIGFSNLKNNVKINSVDRYDNIVIFMHTIIFILVIFEGVIYEIFDYIFL